jgi:hypothetical protein
MPQVPQGSQELPDVQGLRQGQLDVRTLHDVRRHGEDLQRARQALAMTVIIRRRGEIEI